MFWVPSRTRDKSYYLETAAKIAEDAKDFGLNYNIEFLPWAGVRNLPEGISLIDNLAKENVYIDE